MAMECKSGRVSGTRAEIGTPKNLQSGLVSKFKPGLKPSVRYNKRYLCRDLNL